MIDNDFRDDDDIKRKMRNMFMRSNILIRRYGNCSGAVKLLLLKGFCLCLYDASIWLNYSITVYDKRWSVCSNSLAANMNNYCATLICCKLAILLPQFCLFLFASLFYMLVQS